jgi:hypothetical protein
LRIYGLGAQNEGEVVPASAGGLEDEEDSALCMSHHNAGIRLDGSGTSKNRKHPGMGNS